MQKRTGILITLFLCLFSITYAQTGTIKGFLYDRASGEPIIFTNVILEGTKMGVQTDVNGYFSFVQVPEGNYTLFATVIGYDTTRVSINVHSGQIVNKKLFIGHRELELKGVEISARKTEKITRINAGTISVTPREMKLMPSAGGEPDIAQYLQVVPGVIFTGDQGGQLYIRGGSPAQTGILLDGVTIYNPFHSIGLFSVFETDAIRNVDIQSAGFNAQYGNRTSAILDVRTKDGNKNRLSGKLSASPLMARAMLEGPISKPKREGGSSTTFLLSLKNSYLGATSKSIYGGLGEPFKSGLPYDFTDAYGKITFNGDNGSKLNLFGFNFDDKAKILDPITHATNADFKWNAKGTGATFVVTPGSSSALISGKFAYSKYGIDFHNYLDPKPRTSSVEGFEGGIDFTYFLPSYSQLKYGIEVSGQHTSLDYINDASGDTSVSTLERRNTSASLFVMYRKNFGNRFIFEPGFRIQYYSALSAMSPEPRIGLKYNITKKIRLKAAGGFYSQNIVSTRSDRDVVNFFSGFVLSPDQQLLNTDQQIVNNTLEKAYHGLVGLEVDIQNVELNLEPWYKKFSQHIALSHIKSSDPKYNADFIAENGDAYGIDLSAKYNVNRIYLWGVVSYQHILYNSLIRENNNISGNVIPVTYPPPFDRRFNMNLLAAYTAGKEKDWELSIRFNVGSPFPFTQTQGFFENLNLTPNVVSSNPLQQNGKIGIIYASEINGGRLSWYHRMDISARKRFALSKNSNIETTLSVTNIYDRQNIFYVDRVANTRVYQLPVFPSLNVTWNF
jgi:hypothetical protein